MIRVVILCAIGCLTLTGCVNLDLRSMVQDDSVKPVQTGYDCVYQWGPLPVIIGTNSAAQAMAKAGHDVEVPWNGGVGAHPVSRKFVPAPITHVHSIDTQQRAFLFYNELCIQVTGE
jgi:hypothetical protein